VYNAATEAVKQGGTRRGANMGILRVDHPDILEFVNCKNDGGITNFNISVAVIAAFMDALRRDDFYDLVDPHTHEITNRLPAREVWNAIIDSAWRTGDPGLIFIDRINDSPANPTPEVGLIEATNPCGEQPLLPNEACNLGSLNVAKFVVDRDGIKEMDWTELERVTKLCVRFLDDVIEANPYPLPEIDAMVKANRRIGLGIMGWADLLFLLEIPYDSDEAIELADRLWGFVERAGHEESQKLAEVRGPFPNWRRSVYRDGPPLRNSTVTTIAPTGTISIIADASSGIEPIFALAFQHKVEDRKLTFINPIFVEVAKSRGIYSEELMDRVSAQGSVHSVAGVPEDVQRVFVTSHEIAPEWHVRTQAAFQRYTDNGVSKTINLPNSASRSEVEDAYNLAWDLGCLGITVFRDGCKGAQVLNIGLDEQNEQGEQATVERATQAALPGLPAIKPRPRKLAGETHRVATPVGTAYVTVNVDERGEPLEAFVNIGSSGSDLTAVAEALGRLISLVLRTPSPLTQREKIAEIVDQLAGIGGSRSLGFGAQRVLSLPDALAQVLDTYTEKIEEQVELTGTLPELSVKGDICPSCGWAAFVHEEGCKKCHFCGHSEC
jgi:ribonucleoside-diphosphate reductase alpha chain